MRHLFQFLLLLFFLHLPSPWAAAEPLPAPARPVEPDYAHVFHTLRVNRSLYREYQDSVQHIEDSDEWLLFMQRRAQSCSQLYQQNSALISQVERYFGQPLDSVPAASFDSLYHWTCDMFDREYDDVFLLEEFTLFLLPHYEALADTTRLLTLNHYAGYAYTEIARAYEPDIAPKAVAYIERNLDLSQHFEHLDRQASLVIPSDYVNYCYTLAALDAVTPSQALRRADEYAAFLVRCDSLLPEQRKPVYEGYLERIRTNSFRLHVDLDRRWSEADSLAIARMYQTSPYAGEGLSEITTANDTLSYYHAQALLHHMPAEEAYAACRPVFDGMFASSCQQDTVYDTEVADVVNSLITTIRLMELAGLAEADIMYQVVRYTRGLVSLVQRARVVRSSTFFDYVLARLASDQTVFRHLPTGLKEQFMSELAVKSQLGTVVHVNMVERLCSVFLDGLIEYCPEQFIGIMDCVTIDDVREHRADLQQYMQMAALFHDLGKSQMADIVGNEFRRLTDHEFAIIRRHPELSLDYLGIDPLFDKYRDVALGHHRWYNGQGGYPATFDNVSSPWRSMIDLLTLCDCIDAATDFIGRNYRRPKSLSEVLSEFERDAGVRYNPVMVEALQRDVTLYQRMLYVLDHDRIPQNATVRARFMRNNVFVQ